jgi:hypothetical protein
MASDNSYYFHSGGIFLKNKAYELTSIMIFFVLLAITKENIFAIIRRMKTIDLKINKIVFLPSSYFIIFAKSILLMIQTPKTLTH